MTMLKQTRNARNLRNNLTDAEKLLWGRLRMRQFHGLKFRRQQPIENYIIDFLCYEKRLIIELDGGQHALMAPQDAKRTNFLESKGFLVLRFWNNEVFENIEGVLDRIAETINTGHPHPTLPLQGED